jgi:PAS domain S-box-containing protein
MRVDHHRGDESRAFFARLCCTERLEERSAVARSEAIELLSFDLLRSFLRAPETACQELLERVANECVAQLAGILTRESPVDRTRCRWSFGIGALAGQEADWMKPEECPSSLVLEMNKPQLFLGCERVDFFSNNVPVAFHEALAIPFLWGGMELSALWMIRQSNRTPFHQGDVDWLAAIADLVQIATQAARASRCLDENLLRLRWLEELVPPPSGKRALQGWLDAIVGRVQGITKAQSVGLYLQDPTERHLLWKSHRHAQQSQSNSGEIDSQFPAAVDVPIEKGEVVLAVGADGAVADQDDRVLRSDDTPCGLSHVSIPLTVAQGLVLGALAVSSNSNCSPDPIELSWSRLFVRQMASWIALEQMRDKAEQSERRFRAFASALGAVTWTCPAAGKQGGPQPAWIACTNQAAERMLGDDWMKLVHPDDLAFAVAKWNSAMEQGAPFANEHRILGRDQQWHWTSVHALPVRNSEGVVQEWLGFCFDIHSQRQSESAALESHAKLRAAMECMNDALLITDEQGNPVEFNQAFVDFHRFSSRSQVFVKLEDYGSFFRVTTLQGAPVGVKDGVIRRALRGERVEETEYAICRADGGESWVGCFRANPIFDPQQAVRGCVMVASDVTSRKTIEKELRDRESMLRAILNAASDAILVFDREERIVSINPRCEEMFGCVGEKLVGQRAFKLIPSRTRGSVGQSFRRYLQKVALQRTKGVQEAMMMRWDGSQFPAEISLVGMEGDERTAVFIRDITERRELQRRILRATTDEQRRIGQELHDGIQQELTGLGLFAAAVNQAIEQIRESEDRTAEALSTHRTSSRNQLLARLHTISKKLTEGLADAHKHVQALARGILASPVRADELPDALKKLTETAGPEIAFEFVVHGTVGISDDNTASHLYRIAQEAINNAIRHGKASRIKVLLEALHDHIRLEVSDNGNGFHPSGNGEGVGLRTMEYRVQLMHGVFEIEPMEEGGTTVRCILPASHREGNDHQDNCDETKSSSSTFPPANPDGAFK